MRAWLSFFFSNQSHQAPKAAMAQCPRLTGRCPCTATFAAPAAARPLPRGPLSSPSWPRRPERVPETQGLCVLAPPGWAASWGSLLFYPIAHAQPPGHDCASRPFPDLGLQQQGKFLLFITLGYREGARDKAAVWTRAGQAADILWGSERWANLLALTTDYFFFFWP